MNDINENSEKIMSVALKLFSEQGYSKTTTRQIALEAGVNELTLFRRFGTKSNLFQVTTERYVMKSHVGDILDNIENLKFEEAMIIVIKRIYDYLKLNTKLYKVQLKMSDSEKDFVRLKLSRELVTVLSKYFLKLKEDNKINGNPEIMAVTLMNSLLGTFTVNVLSFGTFTNIDVNDLIMEQAKQFINCYKM